MLAKIPELVKRLFPNRIWNMAGEDRRIYLTFDDGPIPEVTPWVLEQLDTYGAKATFFCIGENIKKNPELFRSIISKGHAVGNHTHQHLNGWKTTSEEYLKNVLLAKEIIKEKREEKREKRKEQREEREINFQIYSKASGQKPKQQTTNNKPQTKNKEQQTTNPRLFRPPYGKITGRQARLLEQEYYKIVMWDVLSFDYDRRISTEKCYQNVVKNAVPGSIVVFHDSLKAEKNLRTVLPKVLEFYSKQGFIFEKLPAINN